MELPFEIKAPSGEALSFVDLFTEKEFLEEDNAAYKSDVLEKGLIVDIRRLARERWLEAGSRDHFPTGCSQSSEEQWFKDAPKGSKWKEIAKVLYETGQTIMERKTSLAQKGKSEKGGGDLDTRRRTSNASQQR